jgi:hypothetical protein
MAPTGIFHCSFNENNISVNVNIKIGLDWWEYLGGPNCFIEVITALIRACIDTGVSDANDYAYSIADLNKILALPPLNCEYNVALLQRSQIPWLFLIARHFCDELVD